jgi:pimeloyl-ACP methyl ester carboxylesterase
MRPHEETISVGGIPVHTWVGGQGDPLLVLHGAGGNRGWRRWMERVAERYTVWAPTHPGFGASGDAEWMESVDDLARFYLWWMDAAKLGRPHLLGQSLGGWIAAEMATMASHRLASLVLIDPVGIKVEGWIYPFLFGMDLMDVVGLIFRNPVAALALAPADMSLDTIVEMYRQSTAVARVAWNPYLYDPLLRRRLARITTPTLLAWGAHDRLAPLVCAEAWRKEIPGATLRVFDDSGHVPHIEQPDAVAAAVAEFCAGREARR